MKITRTTKAIKVTCKCGACIAACMIYGGVPIDEEFTDTMAEAIVDGGSVEIVDTSDQGIQMAECKCS